MSAKSEKFEMISAKMQKSVLRHIQTAESSSDEEELEEESIVASIFKDYTNQTKDVNLEKTREFLEQTFQSGTIICLICIASIKRIQPIWNCVTCFSAFHLPCIQRWASSSINQNTNENDPIPNNTIVRVKVIRKADWCCPKCRKSYEQENIPKIYQCFCKKQINPEFQPWLIPHSCGSTCDKPLYPECGHKCLLLCHPGSCPPCPKTITIQCYCKQSKPKLMRCSVGKWSCNKICNKILTCKSHKCEKVCHDGECEPCTKTSTQYCKCKKIQMSRPCNDSEWQCDNVCNKPFACSYHKCDKICHSNECGDCPFTGKQKCPCGALEKDVICPDEVGSCGGTCNKILICGEHTCPNKCHRNSCPLCLKFTNKRCRCGHHVKELPCSKQYFCETKCKIIKSCGRHTCNKKCCDGNCPPCNKPCERTLQCGKHKCPNICHNGFCYPCPLMSRVACRCGQTGYHVPCGRERKKKPPKCNKNCKLPLSCDHVQENVHKCHFGPCPPCKQQCGKLLPCSHKCQMICHNAVPIILPQPIPTGPWEIQEPKIEIRKLPCPPCNVKVLLPCVGGHENIEWLCHEARITSCGEECNQILPCSNHKCSRICHPLEPKTDENSTCENCTKDCELARPEGCKHQCKKGCHPSPCEQCQIYVKKPCYCGITELYIRCYLTTSSEDTDESIFSCKEQCSRLLKCGHRCPIICHFGMCTSVCTKKTKVYCPCRRIKKEMACNLIQPDKSSVSCNDICEEKKKQQLEILKEEERKKREEENERNQRELEEYEKKFGKRKYKNNRRNNSDDNIRIRFWVKYKLTILTFAVIMIAILLAFCNNFIQNTN